MKRLAILGSTGSIGVSTLEIVKEHPDRFKVIALTAGRNLALLEEQIKRFNPETVAVPDQENAQRLQNRIGNDGPRVLYGTAGLIACAVDSAADMIVSAIVGAAGLEPTLAAIQAGKDVALANKETLVIAGELVMAAAVKSGSRIFPVDSEHSAIFQSLEGHRKEDVRRLILTASGGPFRNWSLDDLQEVTPKDALAHPNWTMGRKITIDSATMMNKGLEVIEACWLFDTDASRIEVVLHPQSVIHSMVDYVDGSVLAQLGNPDMRTPIAYGLGWPERIDSGVTSLDLLAIGRLDFETPDLDRFPCLRLAYEAWEAGGTASTVLNAANEVAVQAFLEGALPFTGIPRLIEDCLGRCSNGVATDLDSILAADAATRALARERLAGTARSLAG